MLHFVTGLMVVSIGGLIVLRWLSTRNNKVNIQQHLHAKYTNPKNFTKNGKYKGML